MVAVVVEDSDELCDKPELHRELKAIILVFLKSLFRRSFQKIPATFLTKNADTTDKDAKHKIKTTNENFIIDLIEFLKIELNSLDSTYTMNRIKVAKIKDYFFFRKTGCRCFFGCETC